MDRAQYIRFDLNENTLPPPEHVKTALRQYIDDNRIQMYPDYSALIPKLAQYADADENCLTVTNGSDHAIEIVLKAFLDTGDEMIMASPGFPMFTQFAGVIGAKVHGVPYYPAMRFPYDELTQAIGPKTRLIAIINPDNPTGIAVSLSHIEQILSSFSNTPVIVDEAYFEFTGNTALSFLKSNPNLIIIRTFSKAFAMAALRLGYIIAHPDIIIQINKIRGPFDVNSCALIAASAQIEFPNCWKQYVHEVMAIAKPYVENFFDKNGIHYYQGAANFMLVKPDNRDKAVEYLKNHGILVRPMTAPFINNTFRMNIGTLEQTKKFVEVYKQYIIER
jgi:histidinol-phosphate aminotransferase